MKHQKKLGSIELNKFLYVDTPTANQLADAIKHNGFEYYWLDESHSTVGNEQDEVDVEDFFDKEVLSKWGLMENELFDLIVKAGKKLISKK